MMTEETEAGDGAPLLQRDSFLEHWKSRYNVMHQRAMDVLAPYMWTRWGVTTLLTIIYVWRVIALHGWYIVSYALAIYVLNLFISFLSPAVDPEAESGVLPLKSTDEFRPFVRRLPEFKFWYSFTKAFLVALFCTFVGFFNIPVFWPILLVYFVILFAMTMKKEIQKWIKHGYVPWNVGKPKYAGK